MNRVSRGGLPCLPIKDELLPQIMRKSVPQLLRREKEYLLASMLWVERLLLLC